MCTLPFSVGEAEAQNRESKADQKGPACEANAPSSLVLPNPQVPWSQDWPCGGSWVPAADLLPQRPPPWDPQASQTLWQPPLPQPLSFQRLQL